MIKTIFRIIFENIILLLHQKYFLSVTKGKNPQNMSYQDRFNLKLNYFQENTTEAFQELVDDKDFSDVTLVCEDGSQLHAHKVILAVSSPVFKDLLKMNKHPHPLIFMRGLTSNILTELIRFIYLGKVQIVQRDLPTFLAVADELKIKEMEGIQYQEHQDGNTIKKWNSITEEIEVVEQNTDLIDNTQDILSNNMPKSDFPPLFVKGVEGLLIANPSITYKNVQGFLKEQINILIEKVNGGWGCKKCGKVEKHWKSNMTRHIRLMHLKQLTIQSTTVTTNTNKL